MLDLSVLPPDEHERARLIQLALIQLQIDDQTFATAERLLRWLRKKHSTASKKPINDASTRQVLELGRAMMVASSNAAVIANNASDRRGDIVKNINQCPVLKSLVDFQLIDAGNSLFDKAFPDQKSVRTSVVHGDLFGVPAERRKNALESGSTISGLVAGTRQVGTHKKKVVEMDINMKSTRTLRRVRNHYWAAFAKVDVTRRDFYPISLSDE